MNDRATALPIKVLYVLAAVLFLVLGVVGLIMPIIPGVLFLAGALLLLGKVSRRFRVWTRRHPVARSMRLRMASLGRVGWLDRAKLVGWMTLEMMVSGVRGIAAIGSAFVGKLRR